MELSEEVHPQLKEQYNRYRFMFVALCLSGFLPIMTLVFLYLTGPGLGYLGNKMTFIFVIFILEVPLCGVLGYLLGIKRMRFLKRSSYLVRRGITKNVNSKGVYKISGESYVTCCVDLVNESSSEVERHWVIPSQSVEGVIKGLPELEDKEPISMDGRDVDTIAAFVDTETGKVAAIKYDENVLFFSPPAELF